MAPSPDLVNGDSQGSATTGTPVFSSTATSASLAGSYAIDGSGLSAANYTFVQAAGNATAGDHHRTTNCAAAHPIAELFQLDPSRRRRRTPPAPHLARPSSILIALPVVPPPVPPPPPPPPLPPVLSLLSTLCRIRLFLRIKQPATLLPAWMAAISATIPATNSGGNFTSSGDSGGGVIIPKMLATAPAPPESAANRSVGPVFASATARFLAVTNWSGERQVSHGCQHGLSCWMQAYRDPQQSARWPGKLRLRDRDAPLRSRPFRAHRSAIDCPSPMSASKHPSAGRDCARARPVWFRSSPPSCRAAPLGEEPTCDMKPAAGRTILH